MGKGEKRKHYCLLRQVWIMWLLYKAVKQDTC